MTPDISLILPAYNEARVIPVDHRRSRPLFRKPRLDATRSSWRPTAPTARAKSCAKWRATNPALQATGADARRGKGLGIREAVAVATGTIIGYADADNKVPIEEFDKFRPVLASGVDMVIGSRRGGATIERAQPLYRRVGSWASIWFMQTVVGLARHHTTRSAASSSSSTRWPRRLFRRQKIDGYMFDVEILAIARRLGYRIEQVPIRWRDDADSRLDLVSGNLRNVRDIFRIGLEHRFGGSIEVKAFVTGAAGFIGSNLVDRLLAAGHEVTGFDNFSTGFLRFLEGAQANPRFRLMEGDLLDLDAVKRAMTGADFVFHLAANADVRFGPDHPRRDLEQNTIVTWNVLEAMRAAGVRRIAFASTGSVYGEPEIFPTPETAPFPVQTSLYGASKLAAEGMIAAYATAFGFQAYIFRFVSILGERYTHGHVLDFYRQLLEHPGAARRAGQRAAAEIVPRTCRIA